MDPYLERYWGDVHARLIIYTSDMLLPGLPADLIARAEERVFVETELGTRRRLVPDVHVTKLRRGASASMALREEGGTAVAEPEVFEVMEEEITEGYLEIRERDGGKVITVIEFLSPANKTGGEGQRKYLEKQNQVLHSDASLVEIDLVRSGQRVLALPAGQISNRSPAEGLACISPGWKRSRRELYRMPLRQRLPVLPIPLRQHERALPLDLQALLERVYETGRYEVLDYSVSPEPPLPSGEAEWAAGVIQAASQR
jgi:hypothetical protein